MAEKKKIRMIVTDLDGTLVNAAYEISEENKKAVQAAAAIGVPTVIATGRMHRSAIQYAEAVGVDAPIISYNGAIVKTAGGELLASSCLEPQIVERVLVYVFAKGWYVQSYVGDALYYVEQTEAARVYESASKISGEAVGRGGMLARTAEVPKLLVAVPETEIADVIKELRDKFRNEADVMQSSPNYIEIVRPGVSKARAMLALAQNRGIRAGEIMALGDSGNDIEMIRAAGIGVAMGNAISAAKDAADEVTLPCEENGFAAAVRRFVLD
ncbi:MAG: HAD family phosphatase [Schwartzia sp.]|nr:HAD family phosphatase [Schwartzia sp. (in: firmicutes)]